MGTALAGKYAMLKVEGRWAGRIEDLLAASDEARVAKVIASGGEMLLCVVCAERLFPPARGRPLKTCSDECLREHRANRQKATWARKKEAQGLQSPPTS